MSQLKSGRTTKSHMYVQTYIIYTSMMCSCLALSKHHLSVGGNRKTMQEMVRESIGIAKDPSIFQSYSDFLPEARWLPKAEYEAKKPEEQAQMCLGHSDEQVKLEKLMLPFAAHFLFNSYLGDLGHYQVVC